MGSIIWTVIKLIIFLPITIALIIWLGKVAQKYGKFTSAANGMKIVERLPISKENALLVVMISGKYYLVTTSTGSVDIVREMQDDEVEIYKQQQERQQQEIERLKSVGDNFSPWIKKILKMKEKDL